MGFNMVCVTTGKSCRYGTWHEQRIEIIKITMKYLEAKILEVQEKINAMDDTDDEYINGFPVHEYEYFIERLNDMLIKPISTFTQAIATHKDNDDMIFNIVSNANIYHIKEMMVCFGIYGIHLLCKQSDNSGVYSVGESYDILELLKNIKPYFDKTSEIYQTVYTIKSDFSSPIYDIFYDSITSMEPVRIT
jgi:hypothetical protein